MICLQVGLWLTSDELSLISVCVRVCGFDGKPALVSHSNPRRHVQIHLQNCGCIIFEHIERIVGLAGRHLDCCQTACEMCRSFSSSFGDTSLQEAAFAFGSSP